MDTIHKNLPLYHKSHIIMICCTKLQAVAMLGNIEHSSGSLSGGLDYSIIDDNGSVKLHRPTVPLKSGQRRLAASLVLAWQQ